MLTRMLDAIDEAAGGFIRLAYLIAGITAVAVYFGASNMPPLLDHALNAGLPWILAAAVETHTYISARRVRASWQDMQASAPASVEHGRARASLRVNLGVLAGLLAFSAWNQLGYLASSGWTPGGAAFALPPLAAYIVRALVVPGAFMAAAFLAPLAEPITAQLESEARATLADVFRIARKQRKRLLKEAEASGRDMTGALVELVPDPDARRIIQHAYGAIRGEPVPVAPALALPTHMLAGAGVPTAVDPSNAPSPAPAPAQRDVQPPDDAPAVPPKPPTGPGTPAASKRRASKRRTGGQSKRPGAAAVLQLVPEGEADPERRIRALLAAEPALSVRQLSDRAQVSSGTASKWRRVVRAELERGELLAQ